MAAFAVVVLKMEGSARENEEKKREKKEGIVLPVSLNKHRVILWLNIIETGIA